MRPRSSDGSGRRGRWKKTPRLGATIVLVDESGFSERPSIQRSWAPGGQTPVLRHRFGHWQNLSAIGAVAYSPAGRQARFFLMFVREPVRSEHIIRFLKLLNQHLPGPIIVIWDGINPHRSAATRRFVEEHGWLTVVRLPAHAPELNPAEGAWSWFKRTVVGNFCPDGHDLLARVLRVAGRRLTRREHRRPHASCATANTATSKMSFCSSSECASMLKMRLHRSFQVTASPRGESRRVAAPGGWRGLLRHAGHVAVTITAVKVAGHFEWL